MPRPPQWRREGPGARSASTRPARTAHRANTGRDNSATISAFRPSPPRVPASGFRQGFQLRSRQSTLPAECAQVSRHSIQSAQTVPPPNLRAATTPSPAAKSGHFLRQLLFARPPPGSQIDTGHIVLGRGPSAKRPRHPDPLPPFDPPIKQQSHPSNLGCRVAPGLWHFSCQTWLDTRLLSRRKGRPRRGGHLHLRARTTTPRRAPLLPLAAYVLFFQISVPL